MTTILAIDLGTSSVKVQLVRDDGTLLAESSRPYPTHRPAPGYAEQEPDDWWRATTEAVRAAVSASDGERSDIAAIGVTGQMHGTVLVDDALRPVAPAVIWSDQRAASQVATLEAAVGRGPIIAMTGGRLATGYQAVTIARLRDDRPDLLGAARSVLLPKDWLRARLTGEIVAEPSDAGGTALFDITRRDWSPTLRDAVGLRPDQLPPLIRSTDQAGTLTRDAAVALDLMAGIPVVAGAGDAQAAALGAGVTRRGDLLVTLSTGTQALTPVLSVPADRDGEGQTVCTAIPPESGAGWARVAATLNTGSALRWAAATLGFADDKALVAAAATVPAGARGVLFVPYLGGERSPWFDAGARGSFIGLAADHQPADLARAVVEGITLAGSLAWDAVAPRDDTTAAVITMAGGGARDASWRQLVADAYGLPVRRSETPDQSARGAAILATALLHNADPVALADTWQPALSGETIPDPSRHELYRTRQRLLADAYSALRPIVTGLGDGS